jgi:GrpB-like predicted nucleotidyltransferase (UPF0157 family)
MAIERYFAEFDLTRRSPPVIIVDYQPGWVDEYLQLASHIRQIVGNAALRIDHIGSTAVPGLAAKDVIDVQITVTDLNEVDGVIVPLKQSGFRQGEHVVNDEFRTIAPTDIELQKFYLREPEGERKAHLHLRQNGRFNQRYALLFRDYLRVSESVRIEYEVLKRRAAQLFPESIDGYLFLKDPVFHIIYEAATQWAKTIGWTPDDDYL